MTEIELRKIQEKDLKWHCIDDLSKVLSCNMDTCLTRQILSILGKQYMLLILRVLLLQKSPIRFNNLNNLLPATPKTLTDRLRELEKLSFIKRTMYHKIPIRVEYELTEMGKDLGGLFEAIAIWLRKWKTQIKHR